MHLKIFQEQIETLPIFWTDLWFRASKMAARKLDSSHSFKIWRNFRVCDLLN